MSVALITLSPLAIVQQWGAPPPFIQIPGGGQVHAAAVGWTSGNYMLADVVTVANPPHIFATVTGQTLSLAGSTLTVTLVYTTAPPTQAQLMGYAHSKNLTKLQSGTAITIIGQGSVWTNTDPAVVAQLQAAASKAAATATFTLAYNNQGTWISLTAPQIAALIQGIGAWVGTCQGLELQAVNGITGGTITTTAQIDAIFA